LPRTKIKSTATVETLTLDYQLAELSSSQHRAGLAGLVLVVQWLQDDPIFQEKVKAGAICRLTRLDDNGATLEINQSGLEALFDEIYSAHKDEKAETKLRKNKKGEIKEPIRTEEHEDIDPKTKKPKVDQKTGRVRKKILYFYHVTIPKGSFLATEEYDPTFNKQSDTGIWIKLWRDGIWEILKGKHTSRLPFHNRADNRTESSYTSDAVKLWEKLIKSPESSVKLPGSFFLGAQENNAENVKFQDKLRFQFLLHFWFYTAFIYIPQITKLEKDKQQKKYVEKSNFFGYSIAIPDVSSLRFFCDDFKDILRNRGVEPIAYRPRDVVVDLAIESALDALKKLKERLEIIEGDKSISDLVLGFDVIHAKPGEDVKILGITRIKPDSVMVDEYAQFRGAFRSPTFRQQYLGNLVKRKEWHAGFDALLCKLPYEQTIENKYFRGDVRKKIQSLIEEEKHMAETSQKSTVSDIEILIFKLVKTYVRRKVESKYQLKWKEEWANKEGREKHKGYDEYSEKKSKISKSAFLEVRSRTEQGDFIRYFTGTLCSVPQYMGSDSYVKLAQALYDEEEYEKVRTLTLLALSANG
jgi:CRISPR-associated protein Cmx8